MWWTGKLAFQVKGRTKRDREKRIKEGRDGKERWKEGRRGKEEAKV